MERELHKEFARWNRGGEWFYLSDLLDERIEELCEDGKDEKHEADRFGDGKIEMYHTYLRIWEKADPSFRRDMLTAGLHQPKRGVI